jgi:hypothetical protein
MTPWIVLAVALLIVAGLVARTVLKKLKRARLLETPLTAEQRAIVAKLVPITRSLPDALRAQLEGKMNLFFEQVTFRGHNGITITDEMRLSIAAQACLLIVNSEVWYETLRNVLVYPSTFTTGRESHDGMLVTAEEHGLLGESWAHGPVVLSWDHALQGGLDPDDGHNVVIHEFAHQLDSLSGHTNGIPILRRGQAYGAWEKAMLDAYHHHLERLETARDTVIHPYGATNHQEFFAEAIVSFFEKPEAMRRDEPALYAQLAQLLALDPAEWDRD